MLEKLSSGHMLKFFLVADIATEFGALIHGMFLKVQHRFPDDGAVFSLKIAFMWEFTEINAVSQNFINVLQKISRNLTIRAGHVTISSLRLSSSTSYSLLILVLFPSSWRHLHQLFFWKVTWSLI